MEQLLSQDIAYEWRRIAREQARIAVRQKNRLFDPDDIEPVHELRVSLNKLQTAFANGRRVFPAKSVKSLRAEMKWLKKSLAPVRDLDVMFAHLADLGEPEDHDLASGVEWVVQVVQARRAGAVNRLRRKTECKRYQRLMGNLRDFGKGVKPGRPCPASDLPGAWRLDIAVARMLKKHVEEWDGLRLALQSSFKPALLHDFRIENKKLRYVLGFFQSHRPGLFVPLYQTLTEVHDATGIMHDLDVLVPMIEAAQARHLMRNGDASFDAIAPGVEWTLQRLYELRRAHMRRFFSLWKTLASAEFIERMKEAMSPAPDAPAPADRAPEPAPADAEPDRDEPEHDVSPEESMTPLHESA